MGLVSRTGQTTCHQPVGSAVSVIEIVTLLPRWSLNISTIRSLRAAVSRGATANGTDGTTAHRHDALLKRPGLLSLWARGGAPTPVGSAAKKPGHHGDDDNTNEKFPGRGRGVPEDARALPAGRMRTISNDNEDDRGSRLLRAIESIAISPADVQRLADQYLTKGGNGSGGHDSGGPKGPTPEDRRRAADRIIRRYSRLAAMSGGSTALAGVIPGLGTALARIAHQGPW